VEVCIILYNNVLASIYRRHLDQHRNASLSLSSLATHDSTSYLTATFSCTTAITLYPSLTQGDITQCGSRAGGYSFCSKLAR
jgi:hypothetical protein